MRPDRRRLLTRGAWLALAGAAPASWLWTGAAARASSPGSPESPGASDEKLAGLLADSPFVYVSPIRSDSRESRCHAELWYAWLDDEVVAIVASDCWKAQAIRKGLTRARIWVGDHGRWKGFFFNNEAFRAAPHFDARGRLARDEALLERLMQSYRRKYPAEIAAWEPRMRSGHADGTRTLVRYRRADPDQRDQD